MADIGGMCEDTGESVFRLIQTENERHVDFADITVSTQEDRVMWAGDGQSGCVYAGNRGTAFLRFAMERVAPCVLLLFLEILVP